ncbi:MAG: ABC transporter ATP-binding protein [Planctomycetota bacterium]
MADLRLEHVSKVYAGDLAAVLDLSLRVDDGEFMVVVGPSGCGKTTTLRLIAGLEAPTSGEIYIGGRPVNDVAPKDRDVAMVFQDYAIYPHLTVRQNLAFGLKLRRIERPQIEQRVGRAADLLGITGLLDRKPAALSGGERQRVAVGRAIVRDPRCYLFDEPLSNLDAKLRTQTRAELKALHGQLRTTTVHVTHDQEEAMALGQRVAVLAAGRIQQVGTPQEIYENPANSFVAGFVGDPAMNFVEGRVERQDKSLAFTHGNDLRWPLPESATEPLAAHAGQPVIAGFRPQRLRSKPPGGAARGSIAIEVDVDRAEPLGDHVDLWGRTPTGIPVVARVDSPCGHAAGDRVTLHIAADSLHFFEPGPYGRTLAPHAAG